MHRLTCGSCSHSDQPPHQINVVSVLTNVVKHFSSDCHCVILVLGWIGHWAAFAIDHRTTLLLHYTQRQLRLLFFGSGTQCIAPFAGPGLGVRRLVARALCGTV